MNRTVIAIVFLLAVVLPLVFGACVPKRYGVIYEGGKFGFTNAKDYYRAGRKVELYYDLIATDTDYSFYVDGEPANVSYADNKGYVISFTMPAHDVTVRVDWRNSMEWYGEPYTPEDERGNDETDEPETASH